MSEAQPFVLQDNVDRPELVPLALLDSHPDNPRLVERPEVIEQIRAQINGKFDPAHAILIRPMAQGRYQIVAGHHRVAAARLAELTHIPAWVREMDDEAAFMLLLTSNAQSELSPLERGMHALKATQKGKHGKSINAYAERAGRARQTIEYEIKAATVLAEIANQLATSELLSRSTHLAEIHAAPRWLWRALVEAMLQNELTVERTRALVASVKGFKREPPSHLNVKAIAAAVVGGSMPPDELAEMIDALERFCDLAEVAHGESGGSLEARPDKFFPDGELRKIDRLLDLEDLLRPMRRKIEDELAKRRRAAQDVHDRVRALRQAVSLSQWEDELGEATRHELLNIVESTSSFNKQEGPEIEWAQFSWGPITGCEHDCPYCYARDIVERFRGTPQYPNGFEPTLHPSALAIPVHMRVPPEAETDMRYRNVFCGSLTDWFGRWVPEEWVLAVLKAIRQASGFNFLALTKFPNRMAEFDLPPNFWAGTTVDCQARVRNAEAAFADVNAMVRFLSIEPMLERIRLSRPDLFHWMIIGGASKSSQTPEWHPPFPWIADLVAQAREAGVRVYFKTNLGIKNRILELPFDAPIKADPTEAPAIFHYLNRGRTRLET